MINGYSCENAPIDSNNVTGAWDEHYRRDQTHVPQIYQNLCETDPNAVPSQCNGNSGCGAADAEADPNVFEHFGGHGGGVHGGHGGHGGGHGGHGGGHHHGGWRGGYYGGGGSRGWGWGWPWALGGAYAAYEYPYVVEQKPVVIAAPEQPLQKWILIILAIIVVFLLLRK